MAYFIDGKGCKYPLDDNAESITIGRAGKLKISGDYFKSGVSREHAKLFNSGGKWSISDVGSKFGTYVNAAKLGPEDECNLADGNIVALGNYPMVFRDKENTSDGTPIKLAEPATDK